MLSLPRPAPRLVDGLVAAGLVVLTAAELRRTGTMGTPAWFAYGTSTAACAATAWRRSAPLPVATVVSACLGVQFLAGMVADNLAVFVSMLLAAYSLGLHARGRSAGAAPAAVLLLVLVGSAATAIPLTEAAGAALLAAGAWTLGRLLHDRGRTVDSLRLAVHREEDRARQMVTDERRRIAQELHDVVGHAVSLMVLQTGAARRTLRSDPDRCEELLHLTETSGREAMAELKRLLGIMREDHASLTPQPGLAQVGDLVRRSTAAGKPVTLRELGPGGAVPAGVDLAAYRIVQEALTNSLRHAGACPAEVEVERRPGQVRVSVVDTGPPGGVQWPPRRRGHGLVGMRERAALYDGQLVVEPTDAGGLRVEAVLPTTEAS